MPYACIEDRRAQERRYRERKNALRNARYAANPDPVLERNKRWARANPDAMRAHWRDQRRRRRGACDVVWNAVLRSDPCAYCGILASERHIDHIVPRSRGGEHADTNLTAACGSCNRHKSDRPLLSFMLRRAA